MKTDFFFDCCSMEADGGGVPPEYAAAAATWRDLADGALQNAYIKSGEDLELTGSVSMGRAADGGPRASVPRMLHWAACKGVAFDAVEDTHEQRMLAMAGIVTRILLQCSDVDVRLYKLDTISLGGSFTSFPTEFDSKLMTDGQEIERLFTQLRNFIKDDSVGGSEWRFVKESATRRKHPLYLVCISDVDALPEKGEEMLRDLLSDSIAARHGIYFFMSCSSRKSTHPHLLDGMHRVPPFVPVKPTASTAKDDFLSFLEKGRPQQLHADFVGGAYDSYNISTTAQDMPLPPVSLYGEAFCETMDTATRSEVMHIYDSYVSGELLDGCTAEWGSDSRRGLRAVMGTTEAGHLQFFELGVGKAFDAFHALIGGATGSGKSVLLNEIICSLAERYAPDEVQFLLLDYKEGTEFAPYRNLPHVRALSIGPNPEFGLEVLKDVSEELTRRGQLFKAGGSARSLEEYRSNTGEKLCRYVLVADEFQVLLNDKTYGAEARDVLTDLVRRGRSFGFNAILSTQTLRDGALDGAAKMQFGCRICLRLAEQECSYFLSSDNSEPADFTVKGEAIVNYALGARSGNIPFRSGNKKFPRGFRQTSDILSLADHLNKMVKERNIPLHNQYIYDSDGFAAMPEHDPAQGVLMGVRNNMRATPFVIPHAVIEGMSLIVGRDSKKQEMCIRMLEQQLGPELRRYTPSSFLDGEDPLTRYTLMQSQDGDVELEDALAAWKDECARLDAQPQEEAEPAPQPEAIPMPDFDLPGDMKDDFAELMAGFNAAASLQGSMGAARTSKAPVARGRGRRRFGKTASHFLILVIESASARRVMENAGISLNDFRSILYLDIAGYNNIASNYDLKEIGNSCVIAEMPRGIFSKVRLIDNQG